ncbi:hypothetical protein QF023_001239 [Chryseobacterium sp. SLBN-27]|nr:hypothetical protein [Chryseobacterium sp. SLBN-27]
MNPNFLKNRTSIFAAAALLSVSSISAQTFSDFKLPWKR